MAAWRGLSGMTYEYEAYEVGEHSWLEVPGNYIFARINAASGRWSALYIGETSNLKDRITNHDKWDCARSHGVTHIHAHTTGLSQQKRQSEEQDLIALHTPPCNRG